MIRIGATIDGKYEVTGLLGGGGMGVVAEARHLTLDTLVAIKFMRSDMVACSVGVERFLREARALVKLKSQHVVKVHDMGTYARMPYIVMEHLEGTDMRKLLDAGRRLEVADVARYMLDACEAIAEAHSLGIYHRDLKPANIFLSRGASGRTIVKVLDFGIAKILQPHSSHSYMSLTGAQAMMGTPSYMAPEQIVSARDIDGRADIWSLGVVMYELVTGMLPFQGDSQFLVQRRIQFEAPRANPLPPMLAPIIHRCLEKKREDRYESIVDLALALRPLVHESLSRVGSSSLRMWTATSLHDKQQRELAIAEGIGAQGAVGDLKPQMLNQGITPRGGPTESTTIPMGRFPRRIEEAQGFGAKGAAGDPQPQMFNQGFSADSEIPCTPKARAFDQADEKATVPNKPRRDLAIAKAIMSRCASTEAEPATIRRLPRQIGIGGTLVVESESEPTQVSAVRQDVQPRPKNGAQPFVSSRVDDPPAPVSPWAAKAASTPMPKRPPARAIGIFMVVAAFLAFATVYHW